MHDYFYERAAHILSSRGRHEMMSELTDLYKEFSRLDDDLDSVTERWCERAGISKETIERTMAQMSQEML